MRALLLLMMAACGASQGPSLATGSAYASEQLGCVFDAGTRKQADDCRAVSRARYCARYPESVVCLDGGPP